MDPCPTKPITAIYMSHDYELAGFDRDAYVAQREELVDGKTIKMYKR